MFFALTPPQDLLFLLSQISLKDGSHGLTNIKKQLPLAKKRYACIAGNLRGSGGLLFKDACLALGALALKPGPNNACRTGQSHKK